MQQIISQIKSNGGICSILENKMNRSDTKSEQHNNVNLSVTDDKLKAKSKVNAGSRRCRPGMT
jgi:hypothetical protein